MAGRNGVLGRANGWLHRHFLWLLVGAYLLAAVWPWAGAAIRHTTVLDIADSGTARSIAEADDDHEEANERRQIGGIEVHRNLMSDRAKVGGKSVSRVAFQDERKQLPRF